MPSVETLSQTRGVLYRASTPGYKGVYTGAYPPDVGCPPEVGKLCSAWVVYLDTLPLEDRPLYGTPYTQGSIPYIETPKVQVQQLMVKQVPPGVGGQICCIIESIGAVCHTAC